MNTSLRIAAGLLVALPLVAGAQSGTGKPAVLPADQPRTPLEQVQTQQTGEATKYGQPATSDTLPTSPATKGKPSDASPGKRTPSGSTNETTGGVAPKKAETPTGANPGK